MTGPGPGQGWGAQGAPLPPGYGPGDPFSSLAGQGQGNVPLSGPPELFELIAVQGFVGLRAQLSFSLVEPQHGVLLNLIERWVLIPSVEGKRHGHITTEQWVGVGASQPVRSL